MKLQYPIDRVPATPELVLKFFRDDYEQRCAYDPEIEPGVDLAWDTTIAAWRETCDLVSWRQLAEVLNENFETSYSLDLWRDFLRPEREKNLKGICHLIAKKGVIPRIRPARLFGEPCEVAGVFLTIRSKLHEAGAEVADLRPSTDLHAYTRRHPGIFFDILGISSGKVPRVDVRLIRAEILLSMMGLGIFASLLGAVFSAQYLKTLGLVLIGLSDAMIFLSWFSPIGPSSVKLGDCETFADLSRALAGDLKTG